MDGLVLSPDWNREKYDLDMVSGCPPKAVMSLGDPNWRRINVVIAGLQQVSERSGHYKE
jgi:hypothetical protein